MAIELCSDTNPAGMSPGRISFSYDFCLSENIPVDQQLHNSSSSSLKSNSIDFDFCVRKSFDQESSPADELFSDGKILPSEIKKRNLTSTATTTTTTATKTKTASKSGDEESKKVEAELITKEINKQNSNTKSFWRFKRSSSLNCVSGYGRSLCPLPLLSRSNSTGSKQNKQSFLMRPSSSSSSSSSSSNNSYLQKPPLKKNYGNGGVRVSPVLNVPSGNIFGGFFNSRDKNRKK